jgi:hypothetical protein
LKKTDESGRGERPETGRRAGAVLLAAAIAASAILFPVLIGTTGPASSDSMARLTLESAPLSAIITGPLPDSSEGLFFRPVPGLVSAAVVPFLSENRLALRIVVWCLHALCALLALRVLSRLLGRPAGTTAAVIFVLHPLHAGLCASSIAGIHAGIGLISLLAGLIALAAFRERPALIPAIICVCAVLFAGLSSDSPSIPLIVIAYGFFLPAAGEPNLPNGPGRKSCKGRNMILYALVVAGACSIAAWRWALLGGLPLAAVRPDPAVPLLAAFPLPETVADRAGPWIATGLATGSLLLVLFRSLRDGRRFIRPALGALVLLALALLPTVFRGTHAETGLHGAALPVLFFCGATGILLAGPAQRKPGAVPSFRAVCGISLLAGLLAGAAALAPCLEIREAAGAAATAKKDLLFRIGERQKQVDLELVCLFNQPRIVRIGAFPAVEYLRHDLALETNRAVAPARNRKVPSILPMHGHSLIGERPPVSMFSKRGVLCCAADKTGGVEGFLFSKKEVDDFAATMWSFDLRQPIERSRISLARNGFPISFLLPPGATGFRAMLFTPLGPFVTDCFETRLSYVTGRETIFFNEESVRRRIPLFSGAMIALLAEAFDRGNDLIRQGPFVALHLIAEGEEERGEGGTGLPSGAK